jgi:sialate O-acetylesterase
MTDCILHIHPGRMKRGNWRRQTVRWSAIACALGYGMHAAAEVRPADLFVEHAVLQRDMKVPVWGTAADGESVRVQCNGQSVSTTAKDGTWSVMLEPMKAGGPVTLTITGTNTVVVNDLLIGDVWLCTGQSNMEMAVQQAAGAETTPATADLPMTRNFSPNQHPIVDRAQTAIPGAWRVCNSNNVGGFSAVGFYFARYIQHDLQIPIGLINISWGGSPIESWIDRNRQLEIAQLKPLVEHQQITSPHQAAGQIYNGLVAPLIPYAIRGVLWYQGENNNNPHALLYGLQLKTLITTWRAAWKQGDFEFLSVQLPDFGKPAECVWWPLLREGVRESLALPHTGFAVTVGLGDKHDIHPKDKLDVGVRLATWALAHVYGRKITGSGPLYHGMEKKGDQVILSFDAIGDGLVARGGGILVDFTIAGADKHFVAATAHIAGGTVVVSSDVVHDPVAVRYAWSGDPSGNLTNQTGLPASPFRTDSWDE